LLGAGDEELVLELLDLFVEGLDRLEVAVDQVVQQPVQEEPDAVFRQIWGGIPAGDYGVEVERFVLAYCHQRAVSDEGRDLAGDELRRVGLESG